MDVTMRNYWKNLVIGTAFLGLLAVIGGTFAKPLWAQVRAAMVRDIDTPALAPYRATVEFSLCCINDQRRLITVPVGKRLVLEHISYYSAGQTGDELIFGAFRNGQFGPMVVNFEIRPPHASAASGFTIQDGAMPVKAYFEPGDDVWLSVSHNSGVSRTIQVQVNGYFVTP
jgi:hypothetical protein